MYKRFLFLFVLLISLKIFSQEEEYKLHLKDYHSAQITEIVATQNEETIITADSYGKIISWYGSDFSFKKTLKEANGFLVENLKVIANNKALFYKSKDSIWVIDGNGKELNKLAFKNGQIFSKPNQDYFIISEQKNILKSILTLFDNNLRKIKTFKANTILAANINNNKSLIVYVEERYKEGQIIVCKSIKDNTSLWEHKVADSEKVNHLFFNEKTNVLYAVVIDKEENILKIDSYKEGVKSTIPEIQISWNALSLSTNVKDYFLEDKKIIITKKSSDFYLNPIAIDFVNNKFITSRITAKNGAYDAVYLKEKNQIIASNGFNNNFKDIANFTVYNANNKKELSTYPNFNHKFFKGFFLKDDSFIVYGSKKISGTGVKYYSEGTFFDRYNALSFDDYLEVEHQIEVKSYYPKVDKNTGLYIFNGYDLTEEKYYIFKYNFVKDEVTKLLEIKEQRSSILDFDHTNLRLLLSPREFYNRGHTKPQPLTLIKKNKKEIKFDGLYKFAKFSNDGKYILTINKDNNAQIWNRKNKVVFEEQLKEGSYLIHKADDGFIISNSFALIKYNTCNKESLFLIPQQDETFISQIKKCVYINDLSYKNNKTALLVDGLGVIIEKKIIPIDASNYPKNISFNKDATKLMISYANGKIGVLDTETYKEIGGMFHPSERKHIFYDTNNHYFSNTDASDFLMVTSNNKKVTLAQADKKIFNPSEVLNVFGKPNQEYLKLLNKAIVLRSNKKKLNTITVTNNNNLKKESQKTSEKGDLYVLSIGVSNYEQSNYNLTFADKDAFDIANLYGTLDATTVNEFNTKFLGEKYSLKDYLGNDNGMLKKHVGDYQSIGNLYPVGNQGKIWLEINPYKKENAFIWNYNTKTIHPIKLPKDFKFETLSLDKQIFESVNNKSFFIKTEDNRFYEYTFATNTFKSVEIPFNLIQISSNDLHPLKNDKWQRFKYESKGYGEKIKIFTGKKSSKIDSLIINAGYFKNGINGEVKEANIYSTHFKDVSNDGKQLLFSASEDELYLIQTEKDTIPTKLPIKVTHLEEASISNDGKRITVFKSPLDEDYRYKIISYTIDGEIIDTTTLIDEDYNIKGISIENASANWVEQSESLVDRINYSFKIDKKIADEKPASFKNVKVKYLTNKEANNKNVEKSITDFFSMASKNDQIVLFVAGHGVLDTKNNYYYAPYNMDFNNVTKNGVAFKTIINGLSNSKATHKLLLMDTCHAGNTLDLEDTATETTSPKNETKGQRGVIAKSSKRKVKFKLSSIISSLFSDFLSNSGVTVFSASSGGDVAYENKELGNGAFTTAYLKVLQENLKGTSFSLDKEKLKNPVRFNTDFIDKMLKEVIILTKGKQIPDLRELNKNAEIKVW